jgi:hypothetical protein
MGRFGDGYLVCRSVSGRIDLTRRDPQSNPSSATCLRGPDMKKRDRHSRVQTLIFVAVSFACSGGVLFGGRPTIEQGRVGEVTPIANREALVAIPAGRDLASTLALLPSTTNSGNDLVQTTSQGTFVLAQGSPLTGLDVATTGSLPGTVFGVVEGGALNAGYASNGTWLDFQTMPGTMYSDVSIATSGQDVVLMGFDESSSRPRLFHSTIGSGGFSQFNELNLNLSANYLSRSEGGIRPSLHYDSGLLTMFAETQGYSLEARTYSFSTQQTTSTALGQLTPPPSLDAQYGTDSRAFAFGNRVGLVYFDGNAFKGLAYDPVTEAFDTEKIGYSKDPTASHVSALPFGTSRAVVNWDRSFKGLQLNPDNLQCPISTFGKLRVDTYSKLLGFQVEPSTGLGFIIGNSGGKYTYSPVDLSNRKFAPQSPPGASTYELSNWDRNPISVVVSYYGPDANLLEERTITLQPMETKEYHAQSNEIQAASTTFASTGAFNVLGSWKLGNLPSVSLVPSTTSPSWISPVHQDSSTRHAIAWNNPNGVDNTCTLNLYDGNGGALAGSFDFTLGPWEQLAKYVDELTDLSVGQDFLGSMSLRCDYGVSAIGVQQDTHTNEITYAPLEANQPDAWEVPTWLETQP